MKELFSATVDTPIGAVRLVSTGDALVAVHLPPEGGAGGASLPGGEVPHVLARAVDEIARYFRGEITSFTVPAEAEGTEFRRRVWAALREIPYGETRSYGWLAARVGRPGASRAAGGANGANPLPIVVPCHRVVSADGSIGGYSGGLRIKRFLLDLERRVVGLPPFP